MTTKQELDLLCRLRSVIRNPSTYTLYGVAHFALNTHDLSKYDEALTAQIEKLMARCYGENHRYDRTGGDENG